jgi:soluble lytic murein transglycosylase-like protein
MPRAARSTLFVIALTACSAIPAIEPAPTVEGAAAAPAGTALPSPDAEMPAGAAALADRLTRTTTALDAAIASWRAEGDLDVWPPPDDVVLLALDQQRIYQVLARRKSLRRRTVEMLPRELRAEARILAAAGARLASGSRPVTKTPKLDTTDPPAPDLLRAYYDEAEARFGVDWELLAAVHFIETRFGRVVSGSSAGAQGPMQFVPGTWKAYGLGGNVRNPRDAILGAANYLSASGAPEKERVALLAYNPVDFYADAVALYARQLRRDPDTFYAFYNWQVFVRTPDGDLKRLTGPGL